MQVIVMSLAELQKHTRHHPLEQIRLLKRQRESSPRMNTRASIPTLVAYPDAHKLEQTAPRLITHDKKATGFRSWSTPVHPLLPKKVGRKPDLTDGDETVRSGRREGFPSGRPSFAQHGANLKFKFQFLVTKFLSDPVWFSFTSLPGRGGALQSAIFWVLKFDQLVDKAWEYGV
ncbi:hypothetical protein AXG93_3911s1090 [Marchantia polymorpha subsp. ruderalis]|uniref:Uncharacterized protein n=1 Tax=Marchantia polymorpha subsp. ruderalis TaxID=1480154 RepID=A0A176W2Y6_MARPO|nr:hypothetical protein AXG93_3911s1090 [Marchantia polymorpha subsp. ruderalis]